MGPTVAAGTDVATRLLRAIEARDFDAIAACFSDDALLRAVVPPGVREDVGPRAIADRFRRWLGEDGEHAVLEAEATPFHDLMRLRYVVWHVEDVVTGPTAFEQTAYAEIVDDTIVAVRIACSGNRPA